MKPFTKEQAYNFIETTYKNAEVDQLKTVYTFYHGQINGKSPQKVLHYFCEKLTELIGKLEE